MKKKIFLLLFSLALLAIACLAQTRPTNDWNVVYRGEKGQQTTAVVAEDVDGALGAFRDLHKKDDVQIVGVCQQSYLTCN